MKRIFFAAKNYRNQWVIYSSDDVEETPEIEVIVASLAEVFEKIKRLNEMQGEVSHG